MTKLEQGRAFIGLVERDMGHAVEHGIIDLFFDNAEKLGFTADDCLTVGNAIRGEKGLKPVAKWWK
jgi:hypothetical protein